LEESGGRALNESAESELEFESDFASLNWGGKLEFKDVLSADGLRCMQANSCVIKIVNKINR